MKIAVTYENGEVYQHFGHSEYFKFYEIENGKVVASEVVATDGTGHGALAGFLKERGVEVLLCGGIGGGAIAALAEAGIEVYPGVQGNADESVNAFLGGTLAYVAGANCSHHGHGDHACGSHGGHSCGAHDSHGCGSHGGHSCGRS